MMERVNSLWRQLKSWPAGQRFQRFYMMHARHLSVWARCVLIGAALCSLAIGVVLVFIPGPAVVFFAVSCALAATQSLWIARHVDMAELKGRILVRWLRIRRQRRRTAAKNSLQRDRASAS